MKESKVQEEESSGRSGSKRSLVGRLKELNAVQLGEVVELILSVNPDVCYKRDDSYQICIPQIDDDLW